MIEPFHDQHTCPHIVNTFEKGLQQWFANRPVRWEGNKMPQQSNKIRQATFQAF
jgi:hypothetical protein